MIFYSIKDAIAKGADFQLYEFQRHTANEELWMQKEFDRISKNKNRIVIAVKEGIYITLFVDDKASKDRALIKERYNYGITR